VPLLFNSKYVCFDNKNYFVTVERKIKSIAMRQMSLVRMSGSIKKKTVWFRGCTNSSATTIFKIHPVTHKVMYYIRKSILRKQAYNLSFNSSYKCIDLET